MVFNKYIKINKYFLIPILLLIIFQNLCGQNLVKQEFLKYPLNTIRVYCQNKLDSPYLAFKLFYDNDKKLIQISEYRFGRYKINSTIYKYNLNGLLESQEYYSSDSSLINVRTYKYDENNLLTEEYSNHKLMQSYVYNDLKKIEKKILNTPNNITYYKYNSLNQLEALFRNGLLIASYEYSNNRLVKEIHHSDLYNIVNTYLYNESGLLLEKREDDKVIEKKVYDCQGRLIQQWSNYYGIDPGFYHCSSQYMYLFEYNSM